MWDLHAIQIETINHLKQSIEMNTSFDPLLETSEDSFSMQCAKTRYDSDTKSIGVKVSAQIGFDDDGEPISTAQYWMEIEIEGIFAIDEEKFPIDKLDVWATQNAPLTLYPFVRESAYSLTNRVLKDSAAILPLLTVPTIKV